MRKTLALYESSVGKKVLMALTGAILFGFVLVHMVGNLKVFQGPEKFDAYAQFLREFGYPALGHNQLLWVARVVLAGCVFIHFLAALLLYLQSKSARGVGYRQLRDQSFSYASRTMRWGGVILLAFVVYHLMHLTIGNAHPGFSHESAYGNVISGFQVWWASAAYVIAMVPLGFHIYHGLWSATQTLALRSQRIKAWRRPAAAGVAIVIVLGNISIPLAVLAGIVK